MSSTGASWQDQIGVGRDSRINQWQSTGIVTMKTWVKIMVTTGSHCEQELLLTINPNSKDNTPHYEAKR